MNLVEGNIVEGMGANLDVAPCASLKGMRGGWRYLAKSASESRESLEDKTISGLAKGIQYDTAAAHLVSCSQSHGTGCLPFCYSFKGRFVLFGTFPARFVAHRKFEGWHASLPRAGRGQTRMKMMIGRQAGGVGDQIQSSFVLPTTIIRTAQSSCSEA